MAGVFPRRSAQIGAPVGRQTRFEAVAEDPRTAEELDFVDLGVAALGAAGREGRVGEPELDRRAGGDREPQIDGLVTVFVEPEQQRVAASVETVNADVQVVGWAADGE